MAADDDKKLGKYLLKSKLGQGGMGVVYLAFDTRLRRDVALKVLPKAMSSNADAVKRFLREARVAARLNHPNVVAVHDVDQQRGLCFLVMELVKGHTAAELLAQGELSWTEATRLIADACRGLAAAHEAGLVHRDIKPSNIMRTHEGLVKLADFGLAKAANDSHTEVKSLTQSGAILGTPHYMSPEQCRGEPVDARSDLYSLGATYFTLLTGRPPYPDPQPMQVMFSHCSKPVPDPRTLRADLPAGCSAIVMRALSKSRAERFGSAKEMLAALSTLLASAPKLDLSSAVLPTASHGPAAEATAAFNFASEIPATSIPATSPPTEGDATVIGDPDATQRSTLSWLDRVPRRNAVAAGLVLVSLLGMAWKFWPKEVDSNGDPSTASSGNDGSSSKEPSSMPRTSSLEFVAELSGLTAEVRSVAFSQDRKSLFTAGRDGSVRQWSLADRTVTREFLTGRKEVHAVAVSRRWLVAGGDDLTLWLWDLNTNEPPIELNRQRYSIMSLAISPNGERLGVGTSNSVELYELNAQGGRRIAELTDSEERREMPAYMVHSVAFSADSRWFAAVSWSKSVGIWDAASGELHAARKDLAHQLMSIAFLPGKAGVIFGEQSEAGLFVWDFHRPESAVRSLSSSLKRSARSIVVSPHNVVFVSGEWDGILRTYDVSKDTELGRFQQATSMGATNMAVSPDGRTIAICGGRGSASNGGFVQLWKLVPGKAE